MNSTITTISNKFTGYSATIRTKAEPAVSTIQNHLRAAKCADCKSITNIEIDGIRHRLGDLGNGLELFQC
jgi:hypothetical protein